MESVHNSIGYNYRLSAVHAALGLAQLETLADRIARKRGIAERYRSAWADFEGLACLEEASWAYGSFWLNAVILDPEKTEVDRRALRASLLSQGIETRPFWQPLHRSPAHRRLCAYPCVHADALHRTALCLPSSTGLSAMQQEKVILAIRNALEGVQSPHQ